MIITIIFDTVFILQKHKQNIIWIIFQAFQRISLLDFPIHIRQIYGSWGQFMNIDK